jgi:hypothetical protein
VSRGACICLDFCTEQDVIPACVSRFSHHHVQSMSIRVTMMLGIVASELEQYNLLSLRLWFCHRIFASSSWRRPWHRVVWLRRSAGIVETAAPAQSTPRRLQSLKHVCTAPTRRPSQLHPSRRFLEHDALQRADLIIDFPTRVRDAAMIA